MVTPTPAVRTNTSVDWLLGHGHPVNAVGLPTGRITLATYDEEAKEAFHAWLAEMKAVPFEGTDVKDLLRALRDNAPVYLKATPKNEPFFGGDINRLIPKLSTWLRGGPALVIYGPRIGIPLILKFYASAHLAFRGPQVILKKTMFSGRTGWSVPISDGRGLPPTDLTKWPADPVVEDEPYEDDPEDVP